MKTDIKSNFTLAVAIAPTAQGAGTYDSPAVDLSLGESASWHINAGTIAAGGTLDAKLQHSADGSTGWTDEVSGAGNDTAITQITASGGAALHVVNPRRRYYRVRHVVAVAAVTYGTTSILGPLNSVVPS